MVLVIPIIAAAWAAVATALTIFQWRRGWQLKRERVDLIQKREQLLAETYVWRLNLRAAVDLQDALIEAGQVAVVEDQRVQAAITWVGSCQVMLDAITGDTPATDGVHQ